MPHATTFRNHAALMEHYHDHGADFSASSALDYLMKARSFLRMELIDDMEECVRINGDWIRFNRATDEFAVVRADGIIRTYYKPMPIAMAPPGTPYWKTHAFATNLEYFEDSCLQ